MVAAVGMSVAAWQYQAPIAYEPVGPRAFPLLLAGVMAVAGAWLVARPTVRRLAFTLPQLRLLAISTAAILAYAALFQVLGFALATTLMSVPVGIAFGGRWKQCLAAGAALGLGLYLLFDKVLDVVLPTGLLSWLLGGR